MTIQTDGETRGTTMGEGATSADLTIEDGQISGKDNRDSVWEGRLVSINENQVDITLTMDPSSSNEEIWSMKQNGELTNQAQTATYTFNVKREDQKTMISNVFDHGGVSVFITLMKKD